MPDLPALRGCALGGDAARPRAVPEVLAVCLGNVGGWGLLVCLFAAVKCFSMQRPARAWVILFVPTLALALAVLVVLSLRSQARAGARLGPLWADLSAALGVAGVAGAVAVLLRLWRYSTEAPGDSPAPDYPRHGCYLPRVVHRR